MTAEELDHCRRELEQMQASGHWDYDACQAMLDTIEAELASRFLDQQ